MWPVHYISAVTVDGTVARHYISTDPVGVRFAGRNTNGSHRRHLPEPTSSLQLQTQRLVTSGSWLFSKLHKLSFNDPSVLSRQTKIGSKLSHLRHVVNLYSRQTLPSWTFNVSHRSINLYCRGHPQVSLVSLQPRNLECPPLLYFPNWTTEKWMIPSIVKIGQLFHIL